MGPPGTLQTSTSSSSSWASLRVHRLDGVERAFIVGDVQSNYHPLLELLRAAGLATTVDGLTAWTGGGATLVFLGDLLDGGPDPAEVVWLVMRLHEQAAAAGGRVVLVQGNHELMLFEAMGAALDVLPSALSRWFANGGLETLLRLATAVGIAVPEHLVSLMFTATLGDAESLPDVQAVATALRTEFAPEIDFLQEHAHAAALLNGSTLAVHAAPNFEAEGLSSFVRDERDATTLAWSRGWLEDWEPGAVEGAFLDRLAALKQRLDDPGSGVDLQRLVFAHTPLAPFAVPGFGDKLYRIGSLVGHETRLDVPSVFDLLTAPRAMPPRGVLGGLLMEGESLTAIYGGEVVSDGQTWPQRQAFPGRR